MEWNYGYGQSEIFNRSENFESSNCCGSLVWNGRCLGSENWENGGGNDRVISHIFHRFRHFFINQLNPWEQKNP
jgi:hypothetical protein